MKRKQIAIVLSGFPRRSETFALAEVAALIEQGLVAAVFSTKPGDAGSAQPGAAALRRHVHTLSGTPERQAAEAAEWIGSLPIGGVHAYFAHAPAELAESLAGTLGVPFGFSVHARDARKVARPVLHARARRAACVVACNTDVAGEFNGSGAAVQLVPHGVDLDRFQPRAARQAAVLRLLAVGRLVEKKGFHILLEALAMTPGAWQLRVVGEGPERLHLETLAHHLGIASRVSFAEAVTHESLPSEYAQADIVVVPSIQDSTGDRDGLPNVVLESMASGVAVIATTMGAIASALRDGDTGVLVPPGNPDALANVIAQLAGRPDLRASLGASARRAAERSFDVRCCTERLATVLREAYD